MLVATVTITMSLVIVFIIKKLTLSDKNNIIPDIGVKYERWTTQKFANETRVEKGC